MYTHSPTMNVVVSTEVLLLTAATSRDTSIPLSIISTHANQRCRWPSQRIVSTVIAGVYCC